MASKKRLSPRIESVIVFAAVIAAAALSAFVRSSISGQAFSLNWGIVMVAAAACAAISYLGPALLFHFRTDAKRKDNEDQGK